MSDIKLLGTAENVYYGTFNDISFINGDLRTVKNANKLKQDATKALITRIGEGVVFSAYGSNLDWLLHKNVTDPSIQSNIKSAVTYTFTYMKNMIVLDESGNEVLNTSEQIAEVRSIDIRYDTEDSRKIYLKIDIVNVNGEIITIPLGG
jgi:phage baseplate assembly protein W